MRAPFLRFILILPIAVVPVVWVMWLAHAANRTWTGNGANDLWTTAANWSGGLAAPSAGDDLIFPTSSQRNSVNKFAIGTTFNSISVSGGHSMTGNSISLNSGITAAGGLIDLSSIKLNNDQTFNAPTAGTGALINSVIDNNGKTLTLTGPGVFTINGSISGSGDLTKIGTGTTQLGGNNSYTGTTRINAGTLLVFGSQPNSNVAIGGGTLGATGTVGGITFGGFGGGISPGAPNNGTGILTVNGGASFQVGAFASPGFLEVDLNSATLGTGYDQLKVNGTVTLGDGANSALNVNLGFAPQPGATFTIIDNDGTDAVSGTFANKPEGSSFTIFLFTSNKFFITYRGGDGNDVVLHVPTMRMWDGRKDDSTPSADNKWMTKENWVGDVAPGLGDDLVFPAGASSLTTTNNFPDGTPFGSITLTGNGYTLNGASLKLSGNFTNNPTSAGTNTVNLAILSAAALTSGQNFISGGLSQLILNANNTYAGVTSITSGVLIVNGFQPNSPINMIGGDLRGVGTGGHVTAGSGTIGPSISSASSDVTLTLNGVDCNGGAFIPTFLGGPGGIQNSQLGIIGTLNLNQCGIAFTAIDVFSLPAGTNYTIINNDLADPINGTFTNTPEGSVFPGIGGSVLGITYVGGEGGNDVVLHVPTTRTWDGGGTTNNWKEAANWEGDVAPGPGDGLIFPAGAARLQNNNNFPAGTTFNSITISGGNYHLGGNAIVLNAGINDSSAQTINIIEFASMKLNANQTFKKTSPFQMIIRAAIDTNGKTLTLDGAGQKSFHAVITGEGGLVVNGTGNVQLSGTVSVHTFTGPTIINSGSYDLLSDAPNSPIQLNGGVLRGNQTVKSIEATGGTIQQDTNLGPPLDSINAVSLNSAVTFAVGLLRTDTQSRNGSLTVGGTLNLGDSTLTVDSFFLVTPAPGETFTIINKTSAGPIELSFDGLPEGSILNAAGVPLRISYVGGDGNDVTLSVPRIRTWNGGGPTGNWTDPANWVGNVAPQPGDDLVFPNGAARPSNTNTFPHNTNFHSISILGGGYTLNTVGNNAINLAGNLISDNPTSNPTANTLNLILTGPGSVTTTTVSPQSALILTGNNTYTGKTTINSGVLLVHGNQPLSPIILTNGGLSGLGSIGTLTASGGEVSPGPSTSSGSLKVNGGLTLQSPARFTPRLITSNNVTQNTQLEVTGGVTLNSPTLGLAPITTPLFLPGATFTVISNDGTDAVVGTFQGMPEGANFVLVNQSLVLSYRGGDGNDVVLRVPFDRRWDGGSAVDSSWQTKENWEGDVAPVPGDNLEFPAGVPRPFNSNNFPAGTIFNSIEISGPNYALSGNAILLNRGISDAGMGSFNTSISLPIKLSAPQVFFVSGSRDRGMFINGGVDTNGNTLAFRGSGFLAFGLQPIVGSGGIMREGNGAASFQSINNTYTGNTNISSGSLEIDGLQPQSLVNQTGGTLNGAGTIGPLTMTGGTVSPGSFFGETLTVIGGVSMNLTSTFDTILGSSSNSQLNVQGAVNLDGAAITIRGGSPGSGPLVVINNDGSDAVNGTFAGLPEGAITTIGGRQFQISYTGGDGNDVTVRVLPNLVPVLQFGTTAFNVNESDNHVNLTVFRIGDASSAVSVDFHTADTDNFTVGCFDSVNNQGGAFGRCDFATVVGTLQFAANETQKQITVPIIDDAIVEGSETFQVVLENPVGGGLGAIPNATVTIPANDTAGLPNPIFQSPFFVRQHYLDFLSREPDAGGFNAWVNLLSGCPDVNNLDPNAASAACDRIIVSQSFFGSQEFQLKGFYVFRFYKLAFNRLPEYLEIVSDMSFVAGATAEEVFQRKEQLAVKFTQRQEFQTAFGGLTNAAYVNALLSRYQLTQITTPDPQQPDGTQKVTLTAADLTNQLNNATLTRAQVLRAIADSDQVVTAEFNNAFVAIQYYGYLRRKPDTPGFNAWLGVLQTGDVRTMINGFMNSQEYRLRFGPQ